jgi:hypothetical protein
MENIKWSNYGLFKLQWYLAILKTEHAGYYDCHHGERTSFDGVYNALELEKYREQGYVCVPRDKEKMIGEMEKMISDKLERK